MKQFLSPQEAAAALNISDSTLRKWFTQGRLKGIEIQKTAGGQRRYSKTDIEALAQTLNGKAPAQKYKENPMVQQLKVYGSGLLTIAVMSLISRSAILLIGSANTEPLPVWTEQWLSAGILVAAITLPLGVSLLILAGILSAQAERKK